MQTHTLIETKSKNILSEKGEIEDMQIPPFLLLKITPTSLGKYISINFYEEQTNTSLVSKVGQCQLHYYKCICHAETEMQMLFESFMHY